GRHAAGRSSPMPLEAISDLLERARRGGYALGYFESWDLASLQGALDAAEETRSPTILGFNGEFLGHADRRAPERLALYAALGPAAAKTAKVPCALIFNESDRDDWTETAIETGFNVVGVADNDSGQDYAARVAAIVERAHRRGVAVEAEVDELPCGAAGGAPSGGTATDPEEAARFVAATQVDLLAVSVGNVHIRVSGEDGLDLDRLAAIRARVLKPLVLHGGTGISARGLRAAIELGVAKVNYGTYLKQRCLA